MDRFRGRVRSLTRRIGFDVVRAYPPRKAWTSERLSSADRRPLLEGCLWLSFSLYGTDPLYVEGIARACQSYREVFPGWTPIVFAGDSVSHNVLTALEQDFGAVIISSHGAAEDSSAMFWRYLAPDLVKSGAVLFRDADCRASKRERAAVDEWLVSEKSFHIMRDHPNHTLPMMGGMWGMKVAAGSMRIEELIAQYGPDGQFSGDQRWLASVVHPIVVESCLVHQDSSLYHDASSVWVRPFPVAAEGHTFVGQGLDPDGEPGPGHWAP